ncbi:hypothetical protein BGZ61DRAFT_437506 [Ilyonectria robusta]|uniref:uncharacterized protein n=1 Tax=Ilyonectria robusta TaxID=1079257 RepID=UPI001E8D1BF3|nr:uncharacterized protein BGZ61DRAFT_437506 [Ilyonectria robusta]KAH8737033.1 hypothetical protein BGZ61DRAFT_437506 [Ilyonectria robusta]
MSITTIALRIHVFRWSRLLHLSTCGLAPLGAGCQVSTGACICQGFTSCRSRQEKLGCWLDELVWLSGTTPRTLDDPSVPSASAPQARI